MELCKVLDNELFKQVGLNNLLRRIGSGRKKLCKYGLYGPGISSLGQKQDNFF